MVTQPAEIYPVMLTPFKDNFEIDIEMLEQMTDFYIETGATGLFANCLSSEMFELNQQQRLQITRTAVECVNGKNKVVATGTFGYNQNKNIEFIKQIYDLGVDAVVLNVNQMALETESDEIWKANVNKIIAETGNIPLGLYECPVPYKRLLSPELLRWLAKSNRFVFLKETSCDIHEIEPKVEAVKGSLLKMYNANIPTGLDSIELGASGMASIASNFYPELVQFITQNIHIDKEKVERLNSYLSVIDPLIHEFYPMSAKYFLQIRGMKISLKTRAANHEFTYQGKYKFDRLIQVFESLADEFGIKVYRF